MANQWMQVKNRVLDFDWPFKIKPKHKGNNKPQNKVFPVDLRNKQNSEQLVHEFVVLPTRLKRLLHLQAQVELENNYFTQ